MPAHAPNHRVRAREHLAEATARADEGHLEDCRASLLAATGHSIAQLAHDHQLDAPSISRAMAVLSLRGILAFDPRPLWNTLRREAGQPGSAPSALDAAAAIATVQALVDQAAGVPGASISPAAWQRWDTPAEDDDEPDGEPMPLRGSEWVRAVARERARRRGRRVRQVTATTGCVVGLAALALAWSASVDDTEYRPAKADIGFFDSGS